MSHNSYCLGLCALLLSLGRVASAQVDLSVRVEVADPVGRIGQPIPVTVFVENEGALPVADAALGLRLTERLFFVAVTSTDAGFDVDSLRWRPGPLDVGQVDSLGLVVQPDAGGLHVFTAELMTSGGDDWDSTPGNDAPREDDQRDVCITVPLNLTCGQPAVLRAPTGSEAYTWYRDDTALAYATSDTLHPSASGHYRYTLAGEACASGNCCPVVIEREPCGNDLALVATVAPGARGRGFYDVAVTIYNEGSAAVSAADLYLTTSPYLRLADQGNTAGWQISSSRITYTHDAVIEPGGEAVVEVGFQAIDGGDASDYRVFAEISEFRAGDRVLEDIDSAPDDDPDNDLVVDDGRRLSRDRDEDDSDIAMLTDCAALTVSGPADACFGEAFTLAAAVVGEPEATFLWRGDAQFSCRTCATPEVTATRPTTITLTAEAPDGCLATETIELTGCGGPPRVVRDTTAISVEVGEPLFLADMKDYVPDPATAWEARGGGYKVAFETTGPRTVVFSDALVAEAHGRPTSEHVYLVDVVDYACGPLFDPAGVTVETTRCSGRHINLGLRRPGLRTFASSGRVSAASQPTGERPGATYPIDALPMDGLAGRYEVVDWPGLPEAVGLEGSLQSIVAQLRAAGADAYVDWEERALYAGGGGLGALTLGSATGQRVLAPAGTTLPTYGRLYLRPGMASVQVRTGSCGARLSVKLACKRPPIVRGGTLSVSLHSELVFPFLSGGSGGTGGDPLPAGYAYTAKTWTPEGLVASVAPDSSGLRIAVTTAPTEPLVLGLEACKGEECIRVDYVVSVAAPAQTGACDADVWSEREAVRYLTPGGASVALALPLDFDPRRDRLWVDGVALAVADGGLERLALPTSRTYPARAAVTALRSPFGKTVNVDHGDLAGAIVGVYADATATPSATEVTVVGPGVAGGLYARRADDTWAPVRPLAEVSTESYGARLPAGSHTLVIARETATRVCRDTLAVTVVAAEAVRLREEVTVPVGEVGTYCLPAPRAGGVVVEVLRECEDAIGERFVATWDGDCATLEAFEAGGEEICLRRVYLDGGVDVIRLDLVAEALPELDIVADRDTLEFGEYKVLEVLANDAVTDEALSLSLVSEPYFGRARVVGNSAIEYLHSGGDCAPDVFTYEVCQGDICDSTTVELVVFCEELLIYNGLSPNGDGVNEEFTILGLGQYPDHEISIFDRDGRMLISMRDYANDWRGSISGAPLAEGTYFYVVDLGNGETRSGYLQLTR